MAQNFLANMSKLMRDLQLKYELLVVFGLLGIMQRSYHDFEAHRNQNIENMDYQTTFFYTVVNQHSRIFFPFSHDP